MRKPVRYSALFLLLPALALAQAPEAITPQAQALPPLLSSEHVYSLLSYSILGSLGALGLLLGLDKIIIMLFRRNSTDQVQKYSSESIARILPIVIEGITVILVILTVIILGVSRIISAEGTLGILGSIVGYVLGKSSRKQAEPSDSP